MFNWFRQSGKSEPRLAPAGRSIQPALAARPDQRALTVSEINALVPAAQKLSSHAKALLVRLPEKVRPLHSAQAHPWMLDRLLDKWDNPSAFRMHLKELLIDTRGGRQGFDFDTLTELSVLGDYYNTYVNPLASSGWTSIDPR